MAVEVPHFGVFTNNDANILCEGEKSSPPARSQEQARGFGCATHFLPLTTVDHDFHGATAIQQMARFQTVRRKMKYVDIVLPQIYFGLFQVY